MASNPADVAARLATVEAAASAVCAARGAATRAVWDAWQWGATWQQLADVTGVDIRHIGDRWYPAFAKAGLSTERTVRRGDGAPLTVMVSVGSAMRAREAAETKMTKVVWRARRVGATWQAIGDATAVLGESRERNRVRDRWLARFAKAGLSLDRVQDGCDS